MTGSPDEILTVYQCPFCERVGVVDGDDVAVDSDGLVCSDCDGHLSAANLYDYVDFRVVEYE